jgi:hypothetical protein
MDHHFWDQVYKHWIIAGHLIVDLQSMESGFLEMRKYRQDIWDYIQYRESLLAWPSMKKEREVAINPLQS